VKPFSVEVIIVAYNSGAYLQACIDALALQTLKDFKAVIVDNASTDKSVEDLFKPDDRFTIIELDYNSGFASANNLAISRSSADFVVLLNPDTVATQGWLEALVNCSIRNPALASVGSVQRRLDDPEVLDGLGDVWHVAGLAWRAREGRRASGLIDDAEIFGPCAAGALYRRDLFIEFGGFDERFFCYCEDVDLALRMRLAGYQSMRAGAAVLLHAGSGITGRTSCFSLYYGHRNRIWTFLKNTPPSIFAAAVIYHIAFNLVYLLRAVFRGYFSSVWRAYRDAWVGRAPFLAERQDLKSRITMGEYFRVSAWTPWSAVVRGVHPHGTES
jgi:N-acetylglucosaminyl-diphospho-decaprenol L-rhamnosyltransferase